MLKIVVWSFLVVLLAETTIRAQGAEIVSVSAPQGKPTGGAARLNCTVVNTQNHNVVWVHKNNQQIISIGDVIDVPNNPVVLGETKFDIQKTVEGDRETYMLIIRRLQQEDAGLYECYVRLQAFDITEWPMKSVSFAVADCSLKAEPGLCYGYFPRYHYNTTTNMCEKFIYGGCGGNSNNFNNIADCEKVCHV